ncbi:MAG TPA: peptidoglycan-associated lipoprotein Pal [Candidatus Methylomirabilis sp.]|nr:peptidoglycan-associated lipoprotein Pal [Candidatus Methylomirabilis sp.]
MRRRALLVGVLLLSAGLLAGCPKRPEVVQAGPAAIGPQAGVPAVPPGPAPSPRAGEVPVARPGPPAEAPVSPMPLTPPVAPATAAAAPLRDIFFDYDKSAVRDDQKAALNENIAWLKANGAAKITIEGHADERGSTEYNLGLGERRAKGTKDYLGAAGIDGTRIATISYGKERPFVLGHDESAWKWNRRAHFVISSQ